MIKAVIFDCFGVLAEDGWLPFKRKYIGYNKELAQDIADLGKQNDYGMISIDGYFKQAAEMIGVEEEELRRAVGRRQPNRELFVFITERLKPKYKIGLLSNANFDVRAELFEPDQAAVFDASVISYECRMVKPDPRMFGLMAERLGVAIDECIFVDDIERYCEAADNLGMKALHYKSPEQIEIEINKVLAV